MSMRQKSGGLSGREPDLSSSPQGTLQIGGQECAFNDSKAQTMFVDILTETGAVNGTVCIGLGHLVLPISGNPCAEGDLHLRMSLPMAARVLDALSGAIRTAHAQQSQMRDENKPN